MAATGFAIPSSATEILPFSAINGWEQDDHLAALTAFRQTCDLPDGREWGPLCRLAADAGSDATTARQFFELFFRPVVIGTPPALFTGYFEPELEGSLTRTSRFDVPLYARPPELDEETPFRTRAEIENGALSGRGLELVWLDDPVDAYYLQVQGSGRVRLTDGKVLRLGYAGRNNQPFRPVAQELLNRGSAISDVSPVDIKQLVQNSPGRGRDLLHTNPSYVFFRIINDLPSGAGPIGAMGRPITALRSIAVDPDFTTLGAPVWIEKEGGSGLNRLMVAQDTGGAITGPQRADIFFGTGDAAGQAAGQIKDAGRMVVLLPIDQAYALLPEG